MTMDTLGFCVLPSLLSACHMAAVVTEARALAPRARRVVGAYYRVNDDQSISSPRRLITVEAGPVLQSIHRDEQRLALLERVTGRRLHSTRASYIYYEPGDYIGLHKDASVCEVTLITSIAGTTHPLVVHPDLAQVPPMELVAISRAFSAMPSGGTHVGIPKNGGFLIIFGATIPHHHPAALDSCTIATLCYA